MPIEPTETNLYWGYVGKAPMIWKKKLFTSRGQSEELSVVIIQLVEIFHRDQQELCHSLQGIQVRLQASNGSWVAKKKVAWKK